MKDGSVQTNPGRYNPDVKEPLGFPTEDVKLIKLERCGGDDIFLVNFGTHPDVVGGELICADWPGFLRSTIEKTFDNVKCMVLLGVQGDVNHALLSVIYDLIALDITFLKKNVSNCLLHIGNGNINCIVLC